MEMRRRFGDFRISINIKVDFSKVKERDSVMNTLIPDNIDFPNDLTMKISTNNKSLIINTSGTQIDTVINTVDELLHHISIAKKVISYD